MNAGPVEKDNVPLQNRETNATFENQSTSLISATKRNILHLMMIYSKEQQLCLFVRGGGEEVTDKRRLKGNEQRTIIIAIIYLLLIKHRTYCTANRNGEREKR